MLGPLINRKTDLGVASQIPCWRCEVQLRRGVRSEADTQFQSAEESSVLTMFL